MKKLTDTFPDSSPPNTTASFNSSSLKVELSRRVFLARTALVTAATAIAPSLLWDMGAAQAAVLPNNVIIDTLNGVLAFTVPGGDPYSVQQGQTHSQPGAIEANATLPLMFGLNSGGLAPPPFDTLSELIAFLLNNIASSLNPSVNGPFSSPFANLSFAEKAVVFQLMESGAAGPGLGPVANSLLLYAGLMAYSEAGVLDPATGTLVATPVGWTISGYRGISDGHRDYKGYYNGRRVALP
ncbi:MAG TPA: hypothetical protein VM553_00620 [Dongiaceae bacterium]|nr:hypothetical protein [Dongiaceae bacterium]